MRTTMLIAATVAAAGLAASASARPIFPEVEPNDTKALANMFTLGDGDGVTGTSTGTSTVTAGLTSADYFRIKNVARPLGIYQHRMTLTIPAGQTSFNTATIRGVNQIAAAAGPWPGPVGTAGTTDTTMQTGSSLLAANTRTVQWYGFGKQEELYYRVTGSTATAGAYEATLSSTLIVPTAIGAFNPGPITISTMAGTADTDLWVYDSNLDPIAGYGNDDNSVNGGGTGVGLQSLLTRTYAPGTYYIAMTNFNFANDQGSPSDDDFRTGAMMDFAGVALNSSTTTFASMPFEIGEAGGPLTTVPNSKAGAFDISWYQFEVIPTPGTAALFGLSGLLLARRRRA